MRHYYLTSAFELVNESAANPLNPASRRNLATPPPTPLVARREFAGSAIASLVSVDLADDVLEAAFQPRIAS